MVYLLVAFGIVVVGGLAAIVRRPSDLHRKRALAAPLTSIAGAPEAADVRIEGVVEELDGAREAPVSGRRCVYYEHVVRVTEKAYVGVGPGIPTGTRVVHRAAFAVPFVLRDASGPAIIDPAGATAMVRALPAKVPPPAAGAPPRLDPLARRGDARQTEATICPGDRLIVVGRGVREPDPDPRTARGAYRDGPATRFRMTHSPQFPLRLIAADRR